MITAAQLYDYIACPRRVDLDVHRQGAERAQLSLFIQMLWRRGATHEAAIVADLPASCVMLAGLPGEERELQTHQAMERGEGMIHGGRISADDLLGDPDLLVRRHGGYVAADIKSGKGDDGEDDDAGVGRPKAAYAVQVALYTDVLERLGRSNARVAEIWDVSGRHVQYDLQGQRGPRTPSSWWDLYEETRDAVRLIAATPDTTKGALASSCGLCHWRAVCATELEALDDLSLIPTLGRKARDAMSTVISRVSDLALVDPETFMDGRRTVFAGVGQDRLRTFAARARLLTTPGAVGYLKHDIDLPETREEIFFDIEADPMRDIVYMHGFLHRMDRDPATERFVAFTAEKPTAEAEREAFASAMAHLATHADASVYYYSKYERTAYRKLQVMYPDTCTSADVEALFTSPRSVDLYCDVVTKATEWPTRNHSIKTLAKFLGFKWRDTDPSGAASIEWFDRWVETGDRTILQRILDYNEDDCIATRVLLDGIRRLKPR